MKKSEFTKIGIDFEELNKEFDLEKLESLRDLVTKIISRTDYFAGILEELMQPNSLAFMHEANFVRLYHSTSLTSMYKELMKLNRTAIRIRLDFSNENLKELVELFLKSWKKIKPELLILVTEMEKSWDKTIIHKKEGGYFG
jgi:hypothetical protein